MYREHTLPLLKAMDDEGRLRIVNIRLCSIIDCIFGKLLFFFEGRWWCIGRPSLLGATEVPYSRNRGHERTSYKHYGSSGGGGRQWKWELSFFWQGGIIAHSYCTWSFSKTSNRKWQLLHFFSLLHTIEATASLCSIEWLLLALIEHMTLRATYFTLMKWNH